MSKNYSFHLDKNYTNYLDTLEPTDSSKKIKSEHHNFVLPTVSSPYFNNSQLSDSQLQKDTATLKEKLMQHRNKPEANCLNQEKSLDKKYVATSRYQNNKSEKQTTKKRKLNRFGELTEDEVAEMILPDHLKLDLDIVIVGINPGLMSAYKGHHYVNPCNHFWKCMYLSGIISEPLTGYDDYKLLDYGIGFTNIVARTTKSSSDLTKQEIKDGASILIEKLKKYKPKIAVFNGKGIYEVFSGRKDFLYGKQKEKIQGTDIHIWVMPSSSPRYAQFPTAFDKLHFYSALKKFQDFLNGNTKDLDEKEMVFPTKRLIKK